MRSGCKQGVGAETHRKNNEDICDSCREGERQRKRTYAELNKDKIKATKKAYRERNKETLKDYAAKYQQQNAEQIRIRKSNYQKANPELIVEISQRRRAKKLKAPNDGHTIQDVLSVYGSDCYLCGEAIDLNAPRSTKKEGWKRGLHMEHVVPLSKGGTNLISNVRPSHALCNLLKHVDISDT